MKNVTLKDDLISIGSVIAGASLSLYITAASMPWRERTPTKYEPVEFAVAIEYITPEREIMVGPEGDHSGWAPEEVIPGR